MGSPCEAYKEAGAKVWHYEQSTYGGTEVITGDINFIPFRYQGQYEDAETGLYYNRFRYYSPEEESYISQDPIGLDGGLELYNYVHDANAWVDVFGLQCGTSTKTNGNSKSSSKQQHGYEVYNRHGDVVKTGVSGGRVRKDGKSSRAEKQVRDWNVNKTDVNGPYSSKVMKTIPSQPNAREKILDWEQKNATKHKATLDPDKHKLPKP